MEEDLFIQLIDEHSWQEALGLTVRPDQQQFVAGLSPVAAVGLAKAYVRPGGKIWLPYGIYAGSVMVGFFMLVFAEKEAADAWLFHFFIDQRYQGLGYGVQGVPQVIEAARKEHPEGKGVSLVVHPDNLVAKRLYERAGFRATGEIRWGEPVYRFAL